MTACTYKKAREILGMKFLAPETLKKTSFNQIFKYSSDQLKERKETCPSEEVMWWAFHNHAIVFPGPAVEVSLVDLHRTQPQRFMSRYSDPWYAGPTEEFAADEVLCLNRWYVMRETTHSRLLGYSPRVQIEIFKEKFSSDEEWGSAVVIAYYLLARSIVIGHDHLRIITSSSVTSEGKHVTLYDQHYCDGKTPGEVCIDVDSRPYNFSEPVQHNMDLGLLKKL